MAHILVLEDDLDFGELLMLSLQDEGHHVVLHNTASEALTYLDATPVDLIIADILVRIDGELVADGGLKLISGVRQVRNLWTPIIAISGAFEGHPHSVQMQGSAKTVGASCTIAKPFTPEELLPVVNGYLNKP